MEVARKDYIPYNIEERIPQQPQRKKRVKVNKGHRIAKVAAVSTIAIILAMGLTIVLRFATITEMRHQLHGLNKQVEEAEAQKEKLRAELETVSKSRWIETEAKERLAMTYPQTENTYYFKVDETKVMLLSSQLTKNMVYEELQVEKKGFLAETFNRVLAFLNI
ncbi:hypothetical protein [Alkaliphilus serpentinus]|uniref:Cell division protein FtsL n=1 Tax=Alkaliphilus serpentinus TaxID=1482731 RepID=A0A833M9E1_9FIRM|nr:hypothetical protein [Alkaliphilus serpentinus]KAB3533200.1 hypothetical protein F8153_01235 [Alkaliphilus serpentinus]